MSIYERRILAELRMLHKAEAALQATYETLRGSGAQTGRAFIASLRSLDERMNHFESYLERAV